MEMILDNYIQDLRDNNRSEITIENAKQTIGQFLEYVGCKTNDDLMSVTCNDTNDFLNSYQKSRNVSGSTINQYRVRISAFNTYVRDRLSILVDFVSTVGNKSSKKKTFVILSKEEISLLKRVCSTELQRLVLDLFLSTGMRREEVVNVRLEDIDIRNNTLFIRGKGKKARHIPVSSELLNRMLDFYLGNENSSKLIFATKRGNKRAVNDMNRIINIIVEKTDISRESELSFNITPHLLRKTFATTFYRKTKDIYKTSKLLGHSSVEVTRRYIEEDVNEYRETIVNLYD